MSKIHESVMECYESARDFSDQAVRTGKTRFTAKFQSGNELVTSAPLMVGKKYRVTVEEVGEE